MINLCGPAWDRPKGSMFAGKAHAYKVDDNGNSGKIGRLQIS